MSVLKGFDRIALVLAVIAILPGFVIGYDFHQSEFAKWEKSTKPFDKLEYAPNSKAPKDMFYGRKYVRPPVPISIGVGLVSALASFLIVLYGIRFSIRGGVKLFNWISEGFKDDSPEDGLVKKICPYCAEEIQPDAVKCEHCGEWLNSSIAGSPQENLTNADVVTLDDRVLCPDESCIGVVNSDGICTECERTSDEIHKGVKSKIPTVVGIIVPESLLKRRVSRELSPEPLLMLPFSNRAFGRFLPFFQDSAKPDARGSNFVCFSSINLDFVFGRFHTLFFD